MEREEDEMEYHASDDDDNYEAEYEYDDYYLDVEDGLQLYDTPLTDVSSVKVISRQSLLAAQSEDVGRVMELLSVKKHQARSLLIFYRWDVNKLTDLLAEEGSDRLFARAGVTIVQRDHPVLLSRAIRCGVCFDEVSPDGATAMDCGHFFCNDCWTQYFILKISERQSSDVRCMEPKCNAVSDDEKIKDLVGARDPNLVEKFDRFVLESYINDNSRVKWCPSVPHCENALKLEDGQQICEVECPCGLLFCFSCSSQAHAPCSCKIWQLWCKRCTGGTESAKWLKVHTLPCPKCGKPVEKNGGCNFVYCICRQQFCWLCGGATDNYRHGCGKFDDKVVQEKELAKSDLNRYVHYHIRYEAHLDSLKLEVKLKEKIHDKIATLEGKCLSSKDFSWIENGFDILSRSRRILSLTYPFAYIMFGKDFIENVTMEQRELKKDLFVNRQQQFEENVEKLSLFLEEEFDNYGEHQVMDLRLRIIAVSGSTDNLCRHLYDCIENDLLGSIKGTDHKIAPYISKSVLGRGDASV